MQLKMQIKDPLPPGNIKKGEKWKAETLNLICCWLYPAVNQRMTHFETIHNRQSFSFSKIVLHSLFCKLTSL